MINLTGKVAVVTAAGSGIGRASAMIMAAQGANVLVTDLRREAAAAVAAEIVTAGGTSDALAVDVEQPDQIKAMIDRAVATFGGVDILHNNAALLHPDYGPRDHSLETMDVEAWDRIMAVNLRGVMLACKAVLPVMIARGGGSIISTSSTLGLSGDAHLPAYGVSKAGIIQLTRYVATAYGKNGIRCNAVAPAIIMTPLIEKFLPAELVQFNLDEALTPYLGLPEDVGATVAFLASDDARFITGQVIAVDGGTTAHLPTASAYQRYFAAISGQAAL